MGDEFIGKVVNVGPANSSWVDIGVFTKSGRPVHGRLPFVVEKDGNIRKNAEGAVAPVYVKKVNRSAGRIELRKGVKPPCGHEAPPVGRMLGSLQVGEKIVGTVLRVGRYGAVLDANVYRIGKGGKKVACHGLLPRRSFHEDWYSAADPIVRNDVNIRITEGEAIDVYVRVAGVQNAFFLLDANEVKPEDVAEGRRTHRAEARRRNRRAPVGSLKTGQVLDGTVTGLERYGVFVDVGVKSNGLLHYSKMGERHRYDWKELMTVGTQVSVEVLEIEKDKISLSLISLKEEALRDAIEVARSPTARLQDIEVADALRASEKRTTSPDPTPSNDSNRSLVTTENHGSESDTDAEISEHIEDDDDADQEQEKFSDEYFEDKYGF